MSIFAFLKTVIFRYFPFTSYVKLQDAYVAEQGNAIGNFVTIGYTVPGTANAEKTEGSTTNFTFAQVGSYTDGSITDASAQEVWTATNKATLNDCTGAANWGLQVTVSTSDGATWKTKALSDDCKALTPNFDKVGNGGTY